MWKATLYLDLRDADEAYDQYIDPAYTYMIEDLADYASVAPQIQQFNGIYIYIVSLKHFSCYTSNCHV